MQLDLPTPAPDALAHSDLLAERLREVIRAAGGWISFADFMQQILYMPGYGYYSAGALKFGEGGDFVTAPEISPLFSQCVAGQIAQVLRASGGGTVLEPGAGTGVMAADVLLELQRLDALHDNYLILEQSADLRERQRQMIRDKAPHLEERVRWLDGAPNEPFNGVLIANEVIDALPVERFTIRKGVPHCLGVTCDSDAFVWAPRPAGVHLEMQVGALQSSLGRAFPEGYTSEICLQLPAWLNAVAGWLDRGVALFFDYGFPRSEYYLDERNSGTLRCFYRHRAHEDPFLWPGLQDVTAWVDFSWLAQAAAEAGFEIGGFTTQANFLLAAGIEERVSMPADDPSRQIELARGLRQLLLPGEMGEAIKVAALCRGGASAPDAMFGRDMRARLFS
jgi:SAM-dependent MidA family methyltransferase